MGLTFKKFLLAVSLVCLVLMLSSQTGAFRKTDFPLEVDFLDVGQGDSILINYHQNYQILVDGGPSGKKLLEQLGGRLSPDDRNIEIVVLTHPDQDHLAGLIDLVKNFQIDLLLENGQLADTQTYQEFSDLVSQKGIRREKAMKGSEISVGNDTKISFLNPDQADIQSDDKNNYSIVTRLDYGKNSFLLTGDAEQPVEDRMVSDAENIDVDFLKVSHHGSKTASSEQFLQRVSPREAIISVGKSNRYGHPSEEVLRRFSGLGIQVDRTDEEGTIRIVCQSPEQQCSRL